MFATKLTDCTTKKKKIRQSVTVEMKKQTQFAFETQLQTPNKPNEQQTE